MWQALFNLWTTKGVLISVLASTFRICILFSHFTLEEKRFFRLKLAPNLLKLTSLNSSRSLQAAPNTHLIFR